jgi:hypothetical protein
MPQQWEYLVVEEPNLSALQERLHSAALEGWEATSLGYAGDSRLLALLKRPTTDLTESPLTSCEPATGRIDS